VCFVSMIHKSRTLSYNTGSQESCKKFFTLPFLWNGVVEAGLSIPPLRILALNLQNLSVKTEY